MRTEHLSDDELQTMVLAQQNADAAILDHIQHCMACQQELAVYQSLITGIQEQPAPSFDFDLSNIVLQQLPQVPAKTSLVNIRPFLIVVLGLIPLYIFRYNFLHLATGISTAFLFISITICISILVFKAIKLYRKYDKQIEQLNFSE